MIEISTIATPAVGALIGYSTNWLAIKMLFKPHEAKYIGKIRVPFTPGLIPKERGRIAGSLGTAVGEKLLTEEVISKELLNDKVINHIKSFVVKGLLDQDLTIEAIMVKVLGDEYSIVINKMTKSIEAYVSQAIAKDSFSQGIHSSVKEYLTEKYPHNTLLKTMVPPTALKELEGLLMSQRDRISQFIVDESKNEAVIDKLKTTVSQLLMEQVGALAAMFVNAEDVALSLLTYIERIVFEEEVQKGIVGGLIKGIEQNAEMALSELVPIGQYDALLDASGKFVSEGASAIVSSFDLKPIIRSSMAQFLKMPIQLTSHEKDQIEVQVERLYVTFVKANIGTFLETFELKNVVETQINDFSVDEIEQLIFGIVDKELSAITWFGALLGFVMGIFMLIF